MNRLQTMLGLASKAGALITGTAGVEAAIKKRQVKLVICASDLSAKTIKNFQYFCQDKQIPFFCTGNRSELGHWIGIPERGIIGIISQQFATAISSLLKDGGERP